MKRGRIEDELGHKICKEVGEMAYRLFIVLAVFSFGVLTAFSAQDTLADESALEAIIKEGPFYLGGLDALESFSNVFGYAIPACIDMNPDPYDLAERFSGERWIGSGLIFGILYVGKPFGCESESSLEIYIDRYPVYDGYEEVYPNHSKEGEDNPIWADFYPDYKFMIRGMDGQVKEVSYSVWEGGRWVVKSSSGGSIPECQIAITEKLAEVHFEYDTHFILLIYIPLDVIGNPGNPGELKFEDIYGLHLSDGVGIGIVATVGSFHDYYPDRDSRCEVIKVSNQEELRNLEVDKTSWGRVKHRAR